MGWLKHDDAFHRNRKVRTLLRQGRHDAIAFHWSGVALCSITLSDGFIPTEDLPLVAAEALASEACADSLVAVGLWHAVDGGWEIHDYLDYNFSRAQVVAQREADRERKRQSRGGVRPESEPDTTRSPRGSPRGSPGPPSRPVPSRPLEPSSSSTAVTQQAAPDADDDDDDERFASLIAAAARLRLDQAGKVSRPASWLRSTQRNLRDEQGDQARALLQRYPGAPVSQLAAALNGAECVALRAYEADAS